MKTLSRLSYLLLGIVIGLMAYFCIWILSFFLAKLIFIILIVALFLGGISLSLYHLFKPKK